MLEPYEEFTLITLSGGQPKKENQIKKSMLYMQFYNQLFKMNIIVNIGLCNLNLSVTVFH